MARVVVLVRVGHVPRDWGNVAGLHSESPVADAPNVCIDARRCFSDVDNVQLRLISTRLRDSGLAQPERSRRFDPIFSPYLLCDGVDSAG